MQKTALEQLDNGDPVDFSWAGNREEWRVEMADMVGREDEAARPGKLRRENDADAGLCSEQYPQRADDKAPMDFFEKAFAQLHSDTT